GGRRRRLGDRGFFARPWRRRLLGGARGEIVIEGADVDRPGRTPGRRGEDVLEPARRGVALGPVEGHGEGASRRARERAGAGADERAPLRRAEVALRGKSRILAEARPLPRGRHARRSL